jgi:hypothetical protein
MTLLQLSSSPKPAIILFFSSAPFLPSPSTHFSILYILSLLPLLTLLFLLHLPHPLLFFVPPLPSPSSLLPPINSLFLFPPLPSLSSLFTLLFLHHCFRVFSIFFPLPPLLCSHLTSSFPLYPVPPLLSSTLISPSFPFSFPHLLSPPPSSPSLLPLLPLQSFSLSPISSSPHTSSSSSFFHPMSPSFPFSFRPFISPSSPSHSPLFFSLIYFLLP